MKRVIFGFLLCCTLLTSCWQEEVFVPTPVFASTFTLKEGIELQSSPDTYEEILYMIERMVEEDVMEIKVPYHVNLLELDLFDAYEYAYSRAYQNINATHIEFTSNTSGYQIGYHISAEGAFYMTFSRSDKEYPMTEILEQNRVFTEEVDRLFQELIDTGRYSNEMSEMDRIKVLFDFTMEYLTYDFSFQPISFTAYGAVTVREVVCQGYVAFFNALLKKGGFEVEGVIGNCFITDEGHIWTRVKLGDVWYYFDPTYGDRPSFSPTEGELLYNYTYFDMSQETMLYDRTTTYYMVNSATLVLPT